MKSHIDKHGNLHFIDENDFYVEMLIDDNNKNEPGAVVQLCRDKDKNYNKVKFLEIVYNMSEVHFVKLCNDIRKLQQFAETYHGLSATDPSVVPEENQNHYLEIKHPLIKEDERQYDESNP